MNLKVLLFKCVAIAVDCIMLLEIVFLDRPRSSQVANDSTDDLLRFRSFPLGGDAQCNDLWMSSMIYQK